MAIYFVGDTHGGIDEKKMYSKNFPNYKSCTKDDVVIQLGDWGYIWKGDETEWNRMISVWENRKFGKVMIVPGNHENYNLIQKYPVVDIFKGKARKITDNIYLMERGEIYIIQGYKILSVGGASSIDKTYRVKDIDWFEGELLQDKDISNCYTNLEKYNFNVDFIVSHTCSESTIKDLCLYYNIDTCKIDLHSKFFEELKHKTRYRHWLFGHFHKDLRINKKETVIFNKIWSDKELLLEDNISNE